MKISVITAVYNRAGTIGDAIESLHAQTFTGYEHVVVDGASSDGTLDVVRSLAGPRTRIFSEPDKGIYDALNKGVARAEGDILGFLHSDDVFASGDVLDRVAEAFADPAVDAVYGDLDYVAADDVARIVRRWRSGDYTPDRLAWGWMPPHPALYLRRGVFEAQGAFDTDFRIAADYESILRHFRSPGFRAVYVPQVFVKMRLGGESNGSLKRILRKSREDLRAMRMHRVGGLGTLVMKNARKVGQFL